jgi:hypothetical protein
MVERPRYSLRTRIGLGVLVAFGMLGSTTACGSGFQNGESVLAARDTICWNSPGGDSVNIFGSRFRDLSNEQENLGNIQINKLVTVEANDAGSVDQQGYTRVVTDERINRNPNTGEIFSNNDPATCWVKSDDLKPISGK